MSLNTNLHGRLRNTILPKSHGLLPLFEAVVNSIHAIEEAGLDNSEGIIDIEIIRSPQYIMDLENRNKGPKTSEEIIGFKIADNGIGFNNDNMESFQTLDSEHKIKKGGRGVGRLLWLKAFNIVTIDSIFIDNGIYKRRNFTFDMGKGISDIKEEIFTNEVKSKTIVYLDGFIPYYSKISPKTVHAISNNIFEHCLWYFVRKGGAPKIYVHDEEENVSLDSIYDEYMYSSAEIESLTIKGKIFELTHIKLRIASQIHSLVLCAANRPVKDENITGKIPGLFGQIHDENGNFTYKCYVCSEFLDGCVRPERTEFDIPESSNGLYKDTEISLQDINEAVIKRANENLSKYLDENIIKSRKRMEDFVSQKKPRYRPIMSYLPEECKLLDPSLSDKEIDIILHKHLADIEEKLISDGHDLMKPVDDDDLPKYEEKLKSYLSTAADIKKSDLANYVSHRKVILDLLTDALKVGKDGKYSREDFIHKLIMPMRKESNEIFTDSYNLWIVDERLAFHDYLASDKTLLSMPITGSSDTKEPDIVALNVFDNPILVSEGEKIPLASIEIIEIKRPMRDDAKEGEEKDPIEQALGYLERIRNGKVCTAAGRQIPESQSIPGYCYILCDITDSVKHRAKIHQLIKTSDSLGYFGYNPNFNAYIEVISFDRLVNAAKERNRAFFDKLGLPAN
ncbi:MAG TPA: ATP-binding protein [Firmicutes bacterium]|nr:ATP-binding protein [Bacillota bacterium]